MRQNLIFNCLLNNSLSYLYDYDNNPYTTVNIGAQEWIAQNLKTTHYTNGNPITNLTDNTQWTADTNGAYCWYNNDINYKNPYGALYNWYAIDKRYNDWFLPSENELNAIFNTCGSTFLTFGSYYHTSTEWNPAGIICMLSNTGVMFNEAKLNLHNTRPIRSFASSTSYSLLNDGPAGGVIFYIDTSVNPTLYYEVAKTDLAYGPWSTDDTTLVGTSPFIGYGKINTAAIVSALGSTDNAAKLCVDKNDFIGLAYFKRNGIEETGWKVPSDEDFTTLSNFLGGDTSTGNKLKETGTSHWLEAKGTNESGFTAVPAGFRNGGFQFFRGYNYLWSSTAVDTVQSYYKGLSYDNGVFFSGANGTKEYGMAVRCVKDADASVLLRFTTEASTLTFDPHIFISSGTAIWNLGDASYNVNVNSNDQIDHNYTMSGNKYVKLLKGTTSGASAITSFDIDTDNIVGTIDISSLINLNYVALNNNAKLTKIINPVSNAAYTYYSFSNCDVSGVLDVSGLTGLGGLFGAANNLHLTQILFPNSSQNFTTTYLFGTSLTGTVDISGLTGLGGIFRAYSNPKINYIFNPSTNKDFTEYEAYECGLMGTLDLRPLKRLGGIIDLHSNPSLNTILNPDSSAIFTNYSAYSCNLTGTLDVSALTGLSLNFLVQNNPNLKQILLPSTFANEFTNFNVNNCSLNLFTVNDIFFKIRLWCGGHSSAQNAIINTAGGTNMSPTGGLANTDIVNIKASFFDVGKDVSITIN